MASQDQSNANQTNDAPKDRRRSSTSKPLFANLTAHKSNPDAAARRASFGEQKVGKPTTIGKMWNTWMRGDTGGSGAK